MRSPVLAAAALCVFSLAAHADTFTYTLDGGASGFSGTGTITGSANSSGVYQITGITGTNVTGLIAAGGFNGNDNLFYSQHTASGNTFLDTSGLGFTDQNSTGVYRVDLYGSGGNYYAYVTDNTNFTSTVPVQLSVSAAEAASPAVAPEPSTFVLLGTGLLGMAGVLRRKLFA